MDTTDLRHFICAAEQLNFTRAAELCFISQTAMSQCIARLEQELGFPLFVRDRRRVALTPAGRDFYQSAKGILATLEAASERGRQKTAGEAGSLEIAISSAVDGRLLLPACRHFRREFPNIRISFRLVSPAEMVRDTVNGETDLAVGWSFLFPDDPQIRTQDLCDFPLCVATARDHPFASLDEVTTEVLHGSGDRLLEPVQMPTVRNTVYRNLLSGRRGNGAVPTPRNIEEILLSVELGNGIALLPSYLEKLVRNVAFTPLDPGGEEIQSALMAAVRQQEPSQTALLFLSHLDVRDLLQRPAERT